MIMIRFLSLTSLIALTAWSGRAHAAHGRYRLSVRDDPATNMVVGWDQRGGSSPKLYWDSVDHGTDLAAYAHVQLPDRVVSEKGMNNHFVRLGGLLPDTAYYFVIADSEQVSARYWFKTAPAIPKPFAVVAGGDSRNNREPRRNGNRAVAKLRPLLVLFGGDYTEANDDVQWQEWFDDWQESISPDGRMYPLLATRGNHDSNEAIERLWDAQRPEIYSAVSVGGTMARFYTLNSEIAPGGAQRDWLSQDLEAHRCDAFRVAQYHRPMRAHTAAKAEGNDLYDAWADLFSAEGLDLVVECDSHVVKRTWPIVARADGEEGFVRDDARGTVYIGEGCWGAPLRPDNDAKSWTRAHGSFNEVNWVIFYQDRIDVRTVPTDDIALSASVSDEAPFDVPANLPLWQAQGGELLTITARHADPSCHPIAEPTPGASGSGGSIDAGASAGGNAGAGTTAGSSAIGGSGSASGSAGAPVIVPPVAGAGAGGTSSARPASSSAGSGCSSSASSAAPFAWLALTPWLLRLRRRKR